MRVLVTGGAGYIGSVAAAALIERGDEVAVLDSLWRGHRRAVPPGAQFERVDLRDRPAVTAVFHRFRPDAVLHFGAATLVPESVREPLLYYEVNICGSLNVIEAMLDSGAERIVFSSTAAVYGEVQHLPIAESDRKSPINPYGESKLVVERMLESTGHAHGLNWAALRYFNVAGATSVLGEDHDPETHVIPVALQVALGERPAFGIYGDDFPTPDGTAIRDYVHVVDLADAHLRALDRLDEPLGPMNLGTRDGVSVREIVSAVERVTGSPLPIRVEPRREGDPPALVADSARAREILGWEPRHSTVDEMVASAWAWMTRHPRGYEDR
ncbi:MAG: UDP-glucose 4-epimerase GalE [Thermomicrobiales bacterium]